MTIESIVKESIKSVVCIDDKIVTPYQDEGDKTFSNALYEGLRSSLNSAILMIPYSQLKTPEEVFKNRDLLILDWELEEPATDTIKTLTLVDAALRSEIKYICIYTKNDAVTVKNEMLRYYSGYTEEDISTLNEKCQEEGLFLEAIFGQYPDDICSPDMLNGDVLREKIKSLGISPKREFGHLYDKRILFQLFLVYMAQMKKCPLPREAEFIHECSSSANSFFCVNKKIVMVFKKSDSKGSSGGEVGANDLVDKITEAVISEPNSILTSAWLFYSNALYRQLVYIESPLSGVDLGAFSYAYSQFGRDNHEGANDLVKKLYFQEMESRMDLMKLSLPQCIVEKLPCPDFGNEKLPPEVKKGLVMLNMRMNTNRCLAQKKHLLSFGDVFKAPSSYWMCVSAKCDCSHPDNNNRNYIFIKGQVTDEEQALDDADSQYISFIEHGGSIKAITWQTRIFVCYVELPEVEIGHKLKVATADRKNNNEYIEVEYVTSISPDYAQRMANNVFSFANRVGVSFAQYPPKNSNGSSE